LARTSAPGACDTGADAIVICGMNDRDNRKSLEEIQAAHLVQAFGLTDLHATVVAALAYGEV
jgi:hypothetical protein